MVKQETFITYDHLANEYNSVEHATCRDFDSFSEKLINDYLSEIKVASRILDVGGGTGLFTKMVCENSGLVPKHLDVIDKSPSMLNLYKSKYDRYVNNFFNEPASRFNKNQPYDFVVSLLCDPFLTNRFLQNLFDLVKPGGHFLISFPHSEWATIVREPENIAIATFRDKQGELFHARSLCRPTSNVIENLAQIGFVELEKKEFEFLLDGQHASKATRKALTKMGYRRVPFYVGISGTKPIK